MIEILVTSFPFLIRLGYLRWRGLPVTFYNVHRAVFIWAILALIVFFAVFYYYPKSYTGLLPFRTVPVVAETGGTVTEVFVKGEDHVKEGDVLFTVDDTTQRADVRLAQAQVAEVQSAMLSAKVQVTTAEAALDAAKAALIQAQNVKTDQIARKNRGSAAFRQSIGPRHSLGRYPQGRTARRAIATWQRHRSG